MRRYLSCVCVCVCVYLPACVCVCVCVFVCVCVWYHPSCVKPPTSLYFTMYVCMCKGVMNEEVLVVCVCMCVCVCMPACVCVLSSCVKPTNQPIRASQCMYVRVQRCHEGGRTHPCPSPLLLPHPPCWKVHGPTVLLCGGSLSSSNSITPPATIMALMSTSPSSRRGSSSSSPSPGVGDTASG